VVDQAALHGLLRKVRDLGMPLLAVNRLEPGQLDASEIKSNVFMAISERGQGSTA
jgi:hypothetical protein